MKVVIIKNSELPEPYCFAEGTPEKWVGIGDYDPDKVIPGEVCCDQEGYVYAYPIRANDTPIDENQDFDSWLEMTIDPKYPSARLEFM